MNDDFRTPDEDPDRVSRLSTPAPAPHETVAESRRPALSASYADYDEPLPHDSLPSGRKSRRFETGMSAANAWSAMTPRSSLAATAVTDDERLWAAIAHASAWITLFGGIVSIGAIVPISIFIPLAIFFIFRKKSDYIAFHALQAFVFQLIGTVGAALLLTVGGVVWGIGMVVALVAVLVLVGFVLVPLWALVGLVGLLAIALMPLAMVLYATIGAIETFRGRDYRYPLVSRWIDRQLSGAARIPSRYI